jgi:hypothetical protein
VPGRSGTKKLGFLVVGKRILQDGVQGTARRRAGNTCTSRSDRAAFLARAFARYAEQGIVVERVLSDG